MPEDFCCFYFVNNKTVITVIVNKMIGYFLNLITL